MLFECIISFDDLTSTERPFHNFAPYVKSTSDRMPVCDGERPSQFYYFEVLSCMNQVAQQKFL